MTNLHPRYIKSHVAGFKPLANSVEVFLDYNCPYSGIMFKKVQDELLPRLQSEGLSEKYNIVFVNVVQPWHGVQSSILHDVSFAVSRVKPELFWKVSRAFFDNMTQFYDTEIEDKSRRELTREVIALVGQVPGISGTDVERITELVAVAGVKADGSANNVGNGVAKDSKYFARYARTLGVHVTPSVLVNGIYMAQIESSTAAEKIIEILENQTN